MKLRQYASRMTAKRYFLREWVFTLLACLSASAGERSWVEVRSPHFRVISDGNDNDARRVAREFEQMRAVFSSGFPGFQLDSGAPLMVLAPRDESSMKALAPEFWKRKGAKPAGFFRHGWEKQFAVVQLDDVRPGAYQVVYHEYAHSLLHMNFHWIPLWLDEGLADFYGSTRFEQSRTLVGAPSARFSGSRFAAFDSGCNAARGEPGISLLPRRGQNPDVLRRGVGAHSLSYLRSGHGPGQEVE
jgi:hypothetical protein